MNLELDKRLIVLNKQYQKLYAEYNEVEEQIECLEGDKEIIENQMNNIEEEIKSIKGELLKTELITLNKATGSSFVDDFIRASYFCDKEYGIHNMLQNVNITENELMGCDGYKAIIIKNNEMPNEVKNTLIKWDVREDFENNIEKSVGEYPPILKLIKEAKEEAKYTLEDLSIETLYERVNIKQVYVDEYRETVKLSYKDLEVVVNKEFIYTALMCLNGQEFNLMLIDKLKPILFENDKMQIYILPMRVN